MLALGCSSTRKLNKQNKRTVMLGEVVIEGKRGEKPSYIGSASRVNDIIHVKLDGKFDFDNRAFVAQVTHTVKPYFYPTASLTLDAIGMDIQNVQLKKDDLLQPLTYTYDSLELVIHLDTTYLANQEYQVVIDYRALPDEFKNHKKLKRWADDKGMYFINPDGDNPNKPRQVWTTNEPISTACWIPIIDEPNEKVAQDFLLTVDDSLTTLSNGKQLMSRFNDDGTRTDHWRQTLPHSPYLFTVVAGQFEVVKEFYKEKEVNYYVGEGYGQYAKAIFGKTPEILEFYSKKLNYPYPWDKYSQVVVADFFSGAMENTSASTFFDGMHMNNRALLDDTNEDIVAHEIAHQWFGNVVTAESWPNLPMNEAFATYSEYLWIEHHEGLMHADRHLNRDLRVYLNEASESQKDLIRFSFNDPDDMFDAHSYQKGGLILHGLRKLIGDDAFFAGITAYLKKHEFKNVEAHDFRLALEEITGLDLNWYFNQWFFDKGHPIVTVDFKNDTAGHVRLMLSQENSNDEKKVYRLPLAVDLYYGAESVRHEIVFDQVEQTFFLPSAQKPTNVNFDAERVLLGEIKYEQNVSELANQYTFAPLYRDKYSALRALNKKQEDNEEAESTIFNALKDENKWLRNVAAHYVLTDNREHVKKALAKIATDDPAAFVRATAVGRLVELEDTAYLPIIQKAVYDSSYEVCSEALSGLVQFDSVKALEIAQSLMGVRNFDVIFSVAKVLAKNGQPEHQNYFEENLALFSGGDKYALIYHYGDYLGHLEYDACKTGIESLVQYSKNDVNSWIQQAGVGALERLKYTLDQDQQAVESKLKKKKNDAELLHQQKGLNILIDACNKGIETING